MKGREDMAFCGVAGFLLSGEKVVFDELSVMAIPDELLAKLLAQKVVVPGDEISWEVLPDISDIKEYIGDARQSKLGIRILLQFTKGDYVLKSARWYNN